MTMAKILCPLCGSPVSRRQFFERSNKPFCTRCGWNIDRAEKALREGRSMLVIFALAVAAITLFVTLTSPRNPELLVIPILFGLVALAPFWNYFSTRRMIAAARSSATPGFAIADRPIESALQRLQMMPRPRHVRLTWTGRIAVVVLASVFVFGTLLLAVIFTWNGYPHDSRNSPLIPLLFILFFASIIVIPVVLREQRNWQLLRDGEIALARVSSQTIVQLGKTTRSQIDFEFRTNQGALVRNSQKDLTGNVFEDMTIPVFYDPRDASQNVALCATYLRIQDSSSS